LVLLLKVISGYVMLKNQTASHKPATGWMLC